MTACVDRPLIAGPEVKALCVGVWPTKVRPSSFPLNLPIDDNPDSAADRKQVLPIILPHETSRTIQSGPHELRSNQAISGDEEGAGPLCTNAAIAASIFLESLALTTTTSRPIADATVFDSMRPCFSWPCPGSIGLLGLHRHWNDDVFSPTR